MTGAEPIRVIVVDDQELVRTGFCVILEAADGITVVAEAANGAQAVQTVAEHNPDVILMDVRMPEMDGLEATRLITSGDRAGSPRVVMLTTFDLDEYVYEALRAGASGFLLKDAPRHDLIAAIKMAAAGNALLAPSVTMRLIDAFARRPAQTLPAPSRLASLTVRERDILLRLARGLTNAEIAADLVVSEATVKSHVGNLLAKLGLRDRVQAVILAYETGIVRPGDPGRALRGLGKRNMGAREHASPYGPSPDLTTRNAQNGAAHTANPLNAIRVGRNGQSGYGPAQTSRDSQPGTAYLRRAPEASGMRRRVRQRRFLAGVVSATTGLGLLGEGYAMAVAPRHPALGQMLFFVAIVVPFAIYLTVLMVPRLGSLREITIAILGLYPAIVNRMSDPLVLAGYDEHQHEQSLMNLLQGSGLFAPNNLLRVSPFYPGLEIFTAVGIRLTGLPVTLAESLVVLLCRLLLVLMIYHAALLVSPSRRGASLVVAFYAVSSQFYSFNDAFAYQTLALTLSLGGIYLLRRAQLADYAAARRHFFIASLLLIATVITHHATSWMVLVFLIAWAAMSRKGERKFLVRAAVVMAVAVAIWTAALAPILAEYFVPIVTGALQSARSFLAGTSSHHIFGADAGTPPIAAWERPILVVYTLTCTLAALVCAWIMLSRGFHNRDRMLVLLGALNLAFPITDVAHFNPSVGELGNRAATFLFFPLALSCSLIIQRHPRVIRRPARRHRPFRPAVLIVVIAGTTVTYLGGILLGSNPDYTRLPGPYLVSAENRTQDPETLAAVAWAATHLPAGVTVVADRVPAVLLAGQARLWPVTQPQQGLVPAQLYFSDTWEPQDTTILKGRHIDYIYVDARLADSLPYVGYYISRGETPRATRITRADVAKFAHVPGLKIVYHHGPVTIYSTSGLGVVPKRAGFTGYHPMGFGRWDAILGAAVVLLIVLVRRRLAWVRSAARDIGALGTTLAVMAIMIFIGGALFAVGLMPGPGFTLGAVAASVVILAIRRRMDGLRIVPRLPFPHRLDPLVLLGVVTGAAGLAIAIQAAWITDVADVNAILRAVT